MPEPRSIGPVKPRFSARSGVTTPMPTVRCFQMRLSVSSVSYSSTLPREALREVVDEVEQRALRLSFSALIAFSFLMRLTLYCGIVSGRSR